MRKVGSTTDTADANGEYTNGNVANGISPTIINAEMLNTFQRELVNVVEGAGMELDPADDNQVAKAIEKKVGGGRLLNIKTFTSSGTYTPTPGTRYVIVEAVGGGGGGGGCSSPDSGSVSSAAGGNSGSHGKGRYAVSSNIAVTIGSGGDGGNASSSSTGATVGVAGGETRFGNLLICPGGNSGLAANSFQIPNICQSIAIKTNGVTGSNISSIDGEAGGNGFALGPGISGKGGSNPLGSGGASVGVTGSNSVKGNDGSGYGSGGSGAFAGPGAQGKSGGKGAPGLVIVWELS